METGRRQQPPRRVKRKSNVATETSVFTPPSAIVQPPPLKKRKVWSEKETQARLEIEQKQTEQARQLQEIRQQLITPLNRLVFKAPMLVDSKYNDDPSRIKFELQGRFRTPCTILEPSTKYSFEAGTSFYAVYHVGLRKLSLVTEHEDPTISLLIDGEHRRFDPASSEWSGFWTALGTYSKLFEATNCSMSISYGN
jgi:hypothetical protein